MGGCGEAVGGCDYQVARVSGWVGTYGVVWENLQQVGMSKGKKQRQRGGGGTHQATHSPHLVGLGLQRRLVVGETFLQFLRRVLESVEFDVFRFQRLGQTRNLCRFGCNQRDTQR